MKNKLYIKHIFSITNLNLSNYDYRIYTVLVIAFIWIISMTIFDINPLYATLVMASTLILIVPIILYDRKMEDFKYSHNSVFNKKIYEAAEDKKLYYLSFLGD